MLTNIEQTTQILVDELESLRATIINNIRTTGQWASGKTAASMQVITQGNTVSLIGRSPFGTLETGRKAGPVPRNMRDIIYEWMQAKGIHGEPMPYKRGGHHKYPSAQTRGDMYMASAISHTIATMGTRLYRNGGRDDVYSQAIPATMQRIQARLGVIFQAVIEEQIKSNLKE